MKQGLFATALFALLHGVSGQNCCDVTGANAIPADDSWSVIAVMFSPYEFTSNASYCDRVEARLVFENGTFVELQKRDFLSSHPEEQPFKRNMNDIVLPDGYDSITVIARDNIYGYCGQPLVLDLSADMETSVTLAPALYSTRGPTIVGSSSPVSAPPVMTPVSASPVMTPVSSAPVVVGEESSLPSMTPSAIPSDVPSFFPSESPSLETTNGDGVTPPPTAAPTKAPTTRASGAAMMGAGATTFCAVTALFYLL